MDLTERSEDVAKLGSCPECTHPENQPGNLFCGRCGAALEDSPPRSGELAPRVEGSGATLRRRFLPDGLGPIGRTVAVGLVAVAADMSLAWLGNRLQKTGRPGHAAVRAREEEPEEGSEYLSSYFLKEAAFLIRDERGTLGWYSSESKIKSSRAEK